LRGSEESPRSRRPVDAVEIVETAIAELEAGRIDAAKARLCAFLAAAE
jgi:hypothetical protein